MLGARTRSHATAVAVPALVAAAFLLLPSRARAQLHWDASAQAGVMKRVLADRPPGGGDAGFGPAFQVAAHVALLPLVRLGAYFSDDISPVGGVTSARNITSGGLRAKLMSPWPRGALRAWLFFGFGYSGVYARSTAAPRAFPGPPGGPPTTTSDATVQGASGGFFDVPFGLGASYKLRKPWELSAELGMVAGFGHRGSAYEAPGPQVKSAGRADTNAPPSGSDQFAIGVTVGVLLDL